MDLTKHLSSYLGTGWHRVKITSHELIKYNSGNKGHGYDFVDQSSRSGHDHFPLLENSLWKLANFGDCVGLTSKQMEDFEPEMPIGRKAWVRMAKKGQYHEPVEWASDSETAPEAVTASSGEKERSFDKPVETEAPSIDDDDIPF